MTWILTRSGRKVDLSRPTAAMINHADIAHSLSMQCRFNGHTNAFYSVAEHCLLVASLVPAEHQLAALLHDATEAYVGDLVRPIKEGLRDHAATHDIVSLYDHIEQQVWLAICEQFALDPALPACVHDADLIALATEKRDLMPHHPDAWPCLNGITPRPERIENPLPPAIAAIHYSNLLLQLLATTNRGRATA